METLYLFLANGGLVGMQLLLLAHGLSRLGRTSEFLAGTALISPDIGLAVQHLEYMITESARIHTELQTDIAP